MVHPDRIAVRLQQALENGDLPAEGRQAGRRLMAQLTTPPRVTVIGREGSGKTSVINMLIGDRLFPDLPDVAAVELRHGAADLFRVELSDGSQHEIAGRASAGRVPKATRRLVQEIADLRLKEWNFAEVTVSEAVPDLHAISAWVAANSDIAIWCTESFDDREAMLWADMPEHLKDHSFLVLTRADRLYMRGELDQRIARLQPVVAEEFLRLYPVATKQATLSRDGGAEPDEIRWQASGGKALFDGLRQQVQQARMAALDHAYLLLERYRISLSEPIIAPAPLPSTSGAAIHAAPGKVTTLAPRHDGVQAALDLLQGCADELLDLPDFASPAQTDRVLDRCHQTAEQLVEVFSGTTGLADIENIRDDAIEGEQMLMLLRLERGAGAAEDALTVLLQMKKELAERVPA